MTQTAASLRIVFVSIKERAARIYEEIEQAIVRGAPKERLVSLSHDIRQLKEFACDVLAAGQRVCQPTTRISIDKAQSEFLTVYLNVQARLQGAMQNHHLLCVMPDTVRVDYSAAPLLQLRDQLEIRELQSGEEFEGSSFGAGIRAGAAEGRAVRTGEDGATARGVDHQSESGSGDAEDGTKQRRFNKAAAESWGGPMKVSDRCWCCGVTPGHPIDSCKDFLRLSIDERAVKARQNSQCFRCLAGKHRMLKCPWRSICDLCHGYHHPLIHHAKRTTEPSEQPDDDDDGVFHPDVPVGKIRH